MNDSYGKNIVLERRFAKTIKGILGNQFIIQDEILDKYEGTDFAIMEIKPFKVGCRLRRYKYHKSFKNEFTIRWKVTNGYETEIDKIRNKYVNYILYGFVDENEKYIIQYFIGDLEVFRLNEPKPYMIKKNKNICDSSLAVYRLIDLPKSFIIKKWSKEILCPK